MIQNFNGPHHHIILSSHQKVSNQNDGQIDFFNFAHHHIHPEREYTERFMAVHTTTLGHKRFTEKGFHFRTNQMMTDAFMGYFPGLESLYYRS